VELFKEHWKVLDQDSIQKRKFPPGVTKLSIALTHKGGERENLAHWRPIPLLNVCKKIFAKALQLRLQSVLMEVLSAEQWQLSCLADIF